MIQLKDTQHKSTASLLSSAITTAEYFGFKSIDTLPRSPQAKRIASIDIDKVDSQVNFARREERALGAVVRKFVAVNPPSHGVTLAWKVTRTTGTNPTATLELHIFGTSTVLAEALLIVVTRAILESIGISEQSISINNIGTTESSGRFVRDVGIFLRKNIDSISPSLRTRVESDPIGTLVQLIEKEHPAIARAPQALEYLTEDERRRLWSFLEFLETLGISYEMDGQILGSRDCWAHTLFEVSVIDRESGAPVAVAFGGRYDAMASRYARKPTGAVMVTIPYELRGEATPVHEEQLAPSVFYAYLGSEAQKKSLYILESLRRANIPVAHELWHEHISEQMIMAHHLATPYVVIMGHKEALENAVIVREVANNAQETIPSSQLVGYLKRHRIA